MSKKLAIEQTHPLHPPRFPIPLTQPFTWLVSRQKVPKTHSPRQEHSQLHKDVLINTLVFRLTQELTGTTANPTQPSSTALSRYPIGLSGIDLGDLLGYR